MTKKDPILISLIVLVLLLSLVTVGLLLFWDFDRPLPTQTEQINALVEESIFGAAKDYDERKTAEDNPYFAPELTENPDPGMEKVLLFLSSGVKKSESFSVIKGQFSPSKKQYRFGGFMVNKNQYPLLQIEGILGSYGGGAKIMGINVDTPGPTVSEIGGKKRAQLLKLIEEFVVAFATNPEKAATKYLNSTLFQPEVTQTLGPFIIDSKETLECSVYYADSSAYDKLKPLVKKISKNIKGYGIHCSAGDMVHQYTITDDGKKQEIVGLLIQ